MTVRWQPTQERIASGENGTAPVSFLITSYNKVAYLPAVLESALLEARATDGEIILVDDGSTDGSDQVCAAFAKSHPEVRYWRQENHGIYATINKIAAEARGEWIRFCDSDDPLIPGSTRCLIDTAQKTGAGVAYGRAIHYGPEPMPAETACVVCETTSDAQLHPDGLMYLIRGMNFTPSMAVYRRVALEAALPLPTDLISCQDLALLFPAVSHMPLAWIDAPICFGLKGAANQLSANHALTLQQTIRITQRYAGLLSPDHKRAALLKAANRTRRWLRKAKPGRNSFSWQVWLLGVATLARLGLADFTEMLEKIAGFYEPDLEPLLQRRAKPF